MDIKDYQHDRDFEALEQIWRDVGWISEEREVDGLKAVVQVSDCVVMPVAGQAECAVMATPGLMRHGESDLDMAAITGVTTSQVARRMGGAQALTADMLARQAQAGRSVAVLGMFDQGFYDRVGFGTGAYSSQFSFDPQSLRVPNQFRPPRRLRRDDWAHMHGAMCRRLRGHGGCTLTPSQTFEAETAWTEDPIGLGYFDASDGRLTHFIWGELAEAHGPCQIDYIAYETVAQLFELLSLLKSLGDQIDQVRMPEPPELQFQDLLAKPLRQRRVSEDSAEPFGHDTVAVWQARMLNVQQCLAATHLATPDLEFNVRLTDPLSGQLNKSHDWQGVGGEYVICLGQHSHATRGASASLPTLTATVGAFTRMWLGVRPASTLARTDAIDAPANLLAELDRALRLPTPSIGWDF